MAKQFHVFIIHQLYSKCPWKTRKHNWTINLNLLKHSLCAKIYSCFVVICCFFLGDIMYVWTCHHECWPLLFTVLSDVSQNKRYCLWKFYTQILTWMPPLASLPIYQIKMNFIFFPDKTYSFFLEKTVKYSYNLWNIQNLGWKDLSRKHYIWTYFVLLSWLKTLYKEHALKEFVCTVLY